MTVIWCDFDGRIDSMGTKSGVLHFLCFATLPVSEHRRRMTRDVKRAAIKYERVWNNGTNVKTNGMKDEGAMLCVSNATIYWLSEKNDCDRPGSLGSSLVISPPPPLPAQLSHTLVVTAPSSLTFIYLFRSVWRVPLCSYSPTSRTWLGR